MSSFSFSFTFQDLLDIMNKAVDEAQATAYAEKIQTEALNRGRIEATVNLREALVKFVSEKQKAQVKAEEEKAKEKTKKDTK